ncbi:AsmA-like C-terminal region-containing protein [Jiella sp. M17.18]|uniref:AsmA family protein n=1 Tax=Jiella sp. M17.18 TaxID=3234247 RepID=UPI0034DF033E
MASEAYLTWREQLSGRMRRLAPLVRRPRLLVLGLGAVIVIAAVVALFARVALDEDAARSSVVARLEALTGENVSVDGPVRFSLLPRTRLTIGRVQIGRGNGFDIDQIVADLDPLSALLGRAKPSRLVLVRPALRPDNPLAAISWNGAGQQGIAHARKMLRTFIDRIEGLGVLEIRDGVYRPASARTGGPSGFSNANLTITHSSQTAAVDVAGSLIWNGQPTDIDFKIGAPAALLAGKDSSVDLDIQSPPLTARFSGTATLVRNTGVSGHLHLSSPSFTRSIEWIGNPDNDVPDLGPVAIDGDLLLRGNEASLSNAALTIAGSTGRGALEATFEPSRPQIGGTLAFAQLDLTPLGRSIAPLPNDPFDMERPIDVGFAKSVDLDLRVSANEATLGRVPLHDVAAVVTLGDGITKIDVGDASVFGGRGQATLMIDGTRPGNVVTGSASFSRIDTPRLFSALAIDGVGISGQSSITAKIDAPATDWASIIRNVQVDAKVKARNGAISGFAPQVFARPGARPLAAGTGSDSLPFDTLTASFALSGSRLHIADVAVESPSGTLSASGDYLAETNTVSLHGVYDASPQTASTTGEFTASKPVKFTMDGQWPNPNVTTDMPNPTE